MSNAFVAGLDPATRRAILDLDRRISQHVQSGNASGTADGSSEFSVTFPIPFSTPPKVFTQDVNNIGRATVTAVTRTGFTAESKTYAGASLPNQSYNYDWIAHG